jgi:hypothetical protein
MLMEVTVTKGSTKAAWAQLDLNYDSKTWSVQENTGWGGLGVAKEGYFEVKSWDVMWLGNRMIQDKNNIIILWNPPAKDPDPIHLKGEGRLPKPFNSNYEDARINWSVQGLTPVRQQILDICKGILPATPDTFLTPGQAPMTRITSQTFATGGVTNCGVFPGWIAGQLGASGLVPERVQFPKYQMKDGTWVTPDPVAVTSPMTAWEDFAVKLEQSRKLAAGTLWVPFDRGKSDTRPQPGDFYVLQKAPNGAFAHVGVMIDSVGTTWITADCGQGQASTQMIEVPDPKDKTKKIQRVKFSKGMACGYRRRQFAPADGAISGEFSDKAWLKGWVNVDKLFAGWKG